MGDEDIASTVGIPTLKELLEKYDYKAIHIYIEPRYPEKSIDMPTFYTIKNYCKYDLDKLEDKFIYLLLSGMSIRITIEKEVNERESYQYYFNIPKCSGLLRKE